MGVAGNGEGEVSVVAHFVVGFAVGAEVQDAVLAGLPEQCFFRRVGAVKGFSAEYFGDRFYFLSAGWQGGEGVAAQADGFGQIVGVFAQEVLALPRKKGARASRGVVGGVLCFLSRISRSNVAE